MANSNPGRVTREVRQEAKRRLAAMDLECAGLSLLEAADEVRAGNPASPRVERVYQRVQAAISGLLEGAAA